MKDSKRCVSINEKCRNLMHSSTYLFEVVSFFRPIAPRRPSPHPSDTFEIVFKCLASVNSGSRAFSLNSSKKKPHVINKPHITTNFDSVFNLIFFQQNESIIVSIKILKEIKEWFIILTLIYSFPTVCQCFADM